MAKEITETVWIITHPKFGAYVDFCYTRKEMIRKHCQDKGCLWQDAKKQGDRAVKAKLIFTS